MDILILEHQPDAPPALLSGWARERGHRCSVAAVPAMTDWPDPRHHDAIVSLGSDSSVHADPPPWVGPELDFLRAAHGAGVPLLGICFGAQALALALGGTVRRAQQPEIRWRSIDPGEDEIVLPGPWFFWHEDEFSLPASARLLAGSPEVTGAFAIGRSLGVQFHPEVDGRVIEGWIAGGREQLIQQGVDPAGIRAQIAQRPAAVRARAFDQFDRIAAWWRECSASSSD